jgi:hypothetical protein
MAASDEKQTFTKAIKNDYATPETIQTAAFRTQRCATVFDANTGRSRLSAFWRSSGCSLTIFPTAPIFNSTFSISSTPLLETAQSYGSMRTCLKFAAKRLFSGCQILPCWGSGRRSSEYCPPSPPIRKIVFFTGNPKSGYDVELACRRRFFSAVSKYPSSAVRLLDIGSRPLG